MLFDGECVLCNRLVKFIAERDPEGVFTFAPLQWGVGNQLVGETDMSSETLLLIEGGRCYDRSGAALRIVRKLRFPWPLLYALIIVPRPIRDSIYAWIARKRYRWFGKRQTCMTPDESLRSRFLDDR